MINETRIRCFLTLAETHSFTETAKQLYMTQQGVSKHIAHIEVEMGTPLFVRSRQSVELTDEGKRCYELFSDFFRQYEEFLRDVREAGGQQGKVLRVGYQNRMNFGTVHGEARNALRAEMPELELTGEHHSPGALVQKLLAGDLDMILVSGRFEPKEPGLRSLVLVRSAMVLLVSKNHPGNVEGATYQSFSKALFLIDAFENETPADSMARARRELESYGMAAEKIQVLPNRESVYTAIELGQGVTVGNARTQILSSGTILAYPTQTMETLVCVWREGEKESVSERYAQLLQQGYQQLPQEKE